MDHPQELHALPPPTDPRPRPKEAEKVHGHMWSPDHFAISAMISAQQRNMARMAMAQHQPPPPSQPVTDQATVKRQATVTPVLLQRHPDLVDIFLFGCEQNIDLNFVGVVLSSHQVLLQSDDGFPLKTLLHAYMQKEGTAEAVLEDNHAITQWVKIQPKATLLNIGFIETITEQWVLPRGERPGTTSLFRKKIIQFLEDFTIKAAHISDDLGIIQTDQWLQHHKFFVIHIPRVNNCSFKSILKDATLPFDNYNRIRQDHIRLANKYPDGRTELHDDLGYLYVCLAQSEVTFHPFTHKYTYDTKMAYNKALRRLATLASCLRCRLYMVKDPVHIGTGLGHRHEDEN